MIALAIALGVVGLAAVIAARSVAMAWLVGDRQQVRAQLAKLGEELTAQAASLEAARVRIAALDADAEEVRDEARKLRLGKLARRERA